MGNCQTADAAAVVIQHPPAAAGSGAGSGRVERAYVATSAAAVMAANSGHYVAAVIQLTGPAAPQPAKAKAKRRLKLLRPDDTLALGGVYRLVSFEEVLREFVSKRHTTLSRVVLAAENDAHRQETDCSLETAQLPCRDQETSSDPSDPEPDIVEAAMMLSGRFGLARPHGQWRPALPSIAEGSVVC